MTILPIPNEGAGAPSYSRRLRVRLSDWRSGAYAYWTRRELGRERSTTRDGSAGAMGIAGEALLRAM